MTTLVEENKTLRLLVQELSKVAAMEKACAEKGDALAMFIQSEAEQTHDLIAEAKRVLEVLEEIPAPGHNSQAWWFKVLRKGLPKREEAIVCDEADALSLAPDVIRKLLEALAILHAE